MTDKPRIYWTNYPKSGRGYWRVSPAPKRAHLWGSPLWKAWQFAHRMAREMNTPPLKTCRVCECIMLGDTLQCPYCGEVMP